MSRWSPDLRRDLLASLPALALATVLSVLFLDAKSFWLDEVYSVAHARLDLSGLWRAVTENANMSLYYLILHYWLRFGDSETVVRSLSALAAVASIASFFVLCRRLFGRSHAIVASVLLSVNAFFIHYAQEARSYSLVLLLVTASSALFLQALAKPAIVNWLAYVVVSSLAVYAHFFAGFVILAHSVFTLLSRRAAIRRVMLSDMAIAAAIGPLVFYIAKDESGPTWIKKPSVFGLVGAFESLAGNGGKALLVVYFLSCSFGLYSLFRLRRGDWSADARVGGLLALSWLLIPILGSFVYSYLREPVFEVRYLIVALPPLVMIAALGVVGLNGWPMRALVFVALLALSGRGVVGYYRRPPHEDWRGAAGYVLNSAEAGDDVLFQKPLGRLPFDYYVRRSGVTTRTPRPLFPSVGWGQFDPLGSEAFGNTQEWLNLHAPTARRIWLVLSDTTDLGLSVALPVIPGGDYSRRAERSFTGVRVILYAR